MDSVMPADVDPFSTSCIAADEAQMTTYRLPNSNYRLECQDLKQQNTRGLFKILTEIDCASYWLCYSECLTLSQVCKGLGFLRKKAFRFGHMDAHLRAAFWMQKVEQTTIKSEIASMCGLTSTSGLLA
jgi:hypothetical protein